MRCLVLTEGTIKNLNWLAGVLKKDDYIICVDGGTKYAVELGLRPHIILGDMDSIQKNHLGEFSRENVIIKKHPVEKEHTDTTLAVNEAFSLNPVEIIIIGALGTRFDHALANVHLLRAALEKGIPARIIDEHNEIRLIAPGMNVELNGQPGDLFSLLPLTLEVTGVNVAGARWPLSNATFEIGNPYGVSNRLASDCAIITIGEGLLLVIRTSESDFINF